MLDALERVGATLLKLHGAKMLYAEPFGPTQSVNLDPADRAPTLDALLALWRRLEPPIVSDKQCT